MLATAASAAEAAAKAAFAACRAVALLAAGDWSSLLVAASLSAEHLTPTASTAGGAVIRWGSALASVLVWSANDSGLSVYSNPAGCCMQTGVRPPTPWCWMLQRVCAAECCQAADQQQQKGARHHLSASQCSFRVTADMYRGPIVILADQGIVVRS